MELRHEVSEGREGRGCSWLGRPLKRQQSVWVAAPSDEVHSTQGLLEVWKELPGTGETRGNRESSGVQSLQD